MSERQPPFTCFVASTVGSTVPFQSLTSGAGGRERTQWNSTSCRTTVHVGSVPSSASVPAGMLAATSSFEISWSAAYAMPGTAITSATAATASRLRPRRLRRRAREVGGRGALQRVAEAGQLGSQVVHRVASVPLSSERSVRSPRWTRTRAARGEVPSASPTSS